VEHRLTTSFDLKRASSLEAAKPTSNSRFMLLFCAMAAVALGGLVAQFLLS
jgi:hypothetical protein